MRTITTAALAAMMLMTPTAATLAQNAPKAGGGPAEGGPAGGASPGEEVRPGGQGGAPRGAAPRGAAPGEAKPGAEGQPARPAAPGEVKPGEAKPGAEGQPARPAAPGEAKPGEAKPGAEGQPARPAAPGEAKPGEAKPGAEGQPPAAKAGPARAAPRLDPAQRTQVVTTFRSINVAPVHVDFDVRIGIAVPRTVVLRPVPPDIITIVPGFEGFEFFVVPGEIVIVDPETLYVVEVLPL